MKRKKKHMASPDSTPTVTGGPPPAAKQHLGLFYTTPTYKTEPPPDPTIVAGLTNPYVQGILWRQTWDRLDPNGTGPDFTYLDAAVGASNAHGKMATLEIIPGSGCPAWFFANSGLVLNLASIGAPTSVVWDPYFQRQWKIVNQALAARYDGLLNVKIIKLIGVGHNTESFLINANFPQDQVAADALAVLAGWPNATTAWAAGTTRLTNMYASVWQKNYFMLGTGPPFPPGPPENGDILLQTAMTYGNITYPGRFGVRADNLTHGAPAPGDPSTLDIQMIAPYCLAAGFQVGLPQNINDPNPPTNLGLALTLGIVTYGAHYIEVFASDADDPLSVGVLQSAYTSILAQ